MYIANAVYAVLKKNHRDPYRRIGGEKSIYNANKDFAASDAVMSRCISTAISLVWSEEKINEKGEKIATVIKKVLSTQSVSF